MGEYTQEAPREPKIEEMIKFNEQFDVLMKQVYEQGSQWKMEDLTNDKILPHESQVLWYAVTESTKKLDSTKASDWKSFIEERQRRLRLAYHDENYKHRFYEATDDWLPWKFKLPDP